MTYHPLLTRQLRRVFGSADTVPAEFLPFVTLVDGAYAQFDSDRLLTEHVMTVSSRELTESNATLVEQNTRNAEVLQRLEKAINLLNNDGSDHRSGLDLLQVAHDIEQLAELRRDTENALRAAKIAADSANRAKSEFLANMSHEIRTPLNAVVGMTSLLLDSDMSPDQLDYAETIRASSDALLNIINDILDFSKIEAGKMEVESIPTDLHTTVEQVIDMFSAQTSAQMLDLGAFISPEVPRWVSSDPTRIRQILVNLVGNAIRFTPQGGIGIFVSAVREDGSWKITFEVEDTGIGIPAERLDRLFKAFTQVDSSTTRRFGGTGLGLAISQRLVAMLGGEISVTSEPGQGSTFRFDIRADAISLQDTQPPQQFDIRPLAGRHILIVDDIAINRRILEQQLRGAGFAVTLASGPQAAVEFFLLGNSCDLVLLDYNMPVMNGAELALELDRRHPRGLPPLILLSSRGHHNDEAGPIISRRLAKPVKPSELLSLISDTLLPDSHFRVQSRPTPEYDSSFATRHPLKILVAEDIAVNQKVIDLFLTRLGYRADIVADGLEVIAAHAAGDHDIILMDLQMPEMDGVSATRMLRNNPNARSRPYIIALTANVQSDQQLEAKEAGFQDYLSKPLRPESLANALERAHVWLMATP